MRQLTFGLATLVLLLGAAKVDAAIFNPSFEETPDFTGWTQVPSGFVNTFTIDRTDDPAKRTHGAAGASMYFRGQVPGGGTGVGPKLQSSLFSANAGDVVSVDWRLVVGLTGGNWDTGFGWGDLIDTSTSSPVASLFSAGPIPRGTTTPWATGAVTVPSAGTYLLEFGISSRDDTSGGVIGAALRLDNVQVVAIPEPSTLIVWSLLAALGITFGWCKKRKR